ncbi:hypothetical protein AAE02nite_45140 [Adhaeribacter aerolatus]|uniref:Uncharacterized protein n=1 Tax=Adhaeribacter aerolatus TaxID=670289 RepID=A0A512B4H1_9BACT|nr:hypothetical protein [Adhaeribacter aerolatus]GEO06850.1 hypothetical protein AAE02nite_45140 [Adhaeribacter aerolatus]
MEKEIFFLFNPDAPEPVFPPKEKYRTTLRQTPAQKRTEKKVNSFKLRATICKVFSSTWWN